MVFSSRRDRNYVHVRNGFVEKPPLYKYINFYSKYMSEDDRYYMCYTCQCDMFSTTTANDIMYTPCAGQLKCFIRNNYRSICYNCRKISNTSCPCGKCSSCDNRREKIKEKYTHEKLISILNDINEYDINEEYPLMVAANENYSILLEEDLLPTEESVNIYDLFCLKGQDESLINFLIEKKLQFTSDNIYRILSKLYIFYHVTSGIVEIIKRIPNYENLLVECVNLCFRKIEGNLKKKEVSCDAICALYVVVKVLSFLELKYLYDPSMGIHEILRKVIEVQDNIKIPRYWGMNDIKEIINESYVYFLQFSMNKVEWKKHMFLIASSRIL